MASGDLEALGFPSFGVLRFGFGFEFSTPQSQGLGPRV